MKNPKGTTDRDLCPDETRINRYLLRQCSPLERREIERHISSCSLCRAEVVFLTRNKEEILDEQKWGELPDRLYDQGMAFVKSMKEIQGKQESRLEIFLRFIHDQWEILRSTGTLIPQPILSVRREASQHKVPLSTVVKEFDHYRVEVEFTEGMKGTIDLQVRVKGITEEDLVQRIRFTLRDDEKQRILEEFTREGEISFSGLRPGLYSIEITQLEKSIGDIFLNLKRD